MGEKMKNLRAYLQTLPKPVLAAVLVVGLLVFTAVMLLTLRQPAATPTPPEVIRTASPAPTPSVSPSPSLNDKFPPPASINDQDPQSRNPMMVYLPEDNQYWSLIFEGGPEGDYKLRAIVYRFEAENPDKKIAEQRDQIINFIRSTGQPDGTYTIEYQTEVVKDQG